MANRLVLGAFEGTFGLKISKPGFNVLATTLGSKQLAFDSRWGWISRVIMSGDVTLANNATQVINFSVTLPAVPQIVIARKIGSAWTTFNPDAQPFEAPVFTRSRLRAVSASSFTLGNDSGASTVIRYYVLLP